MLKLSQAVQSLAQVIRQKKGRIVVAKHEVIDLLLTALLREGHALLEDVPGTGKATMAKSLARSLSCHLG